MVWLVIHECEQERWEARAIERGEGLNGPPRRKTRVVRGVKGIGRMGGGPSMINMRK
jgi:hypothetical protein